MIKVRVVSLEGVYYRKKELLYILNLLLSSIPISSHQFLQTVLVDVADTEDAKLRAWPLMNESPFSTCHGVFMVICFCT